MKKSIIQDKSFEFSLAIIDLYKQLLRSGTSIGANIEEIIYILTTIVKTSQSNIKQSS